ncbi:MAG TPA: hypothetical protein VFH42_00265 [Sporolactobacillaceae bacterium]|nr:hypothetical protein [Sporolactobacillaceae bacterium]
MTDVKRHLFSVSLKEFPEMKVERVVELPADFTQTDIDNDFKKWVEKHILINRHELNTYKRR